MADFTVPKIDFSFLSELPKSYELGRQAGRESQLRQAFSGGLPTKDGVTDWDSVIKTLMPLDPASGIELATRIHPTLDPYKAAELGIQKERLTVEQQRADEAAKTPLMKEYEAQYGPITKAGEQPVGGQQKPTLEEYAQSKKISVLPKPQAQQHLDLINDSMDSLYNLAKKIYDDPQTNYQVGSFGMIPSVPGSRGADVNASIDNLTTQTGLAAVNALKEASTKSGATGFGRITQYEFQALQRAIASLDKRQSPEAFKANLKTIMDFAERAKKRSGDAFYSQYGRQQDGPVTTPAEAPLNAPPVPGAMQPIQNDPRGPLIPPPPANINQRELQLTQQAREAIAAGADPAAVQQELQRLLQQGQ